MASSEVLRSYKIERNFRFALSAGEETLDDRGKSVNDMCLAFQLALAR